MVLVNPIKAHTRYGWAMLPVTPTRFFYVDPPYFGCEDIYGKGLFSKQDFTTLRDQLAGVKGKFIMSINNAPEIRELFNDFHIREAGTKYTLSSKGTKSVTELLISNFKLR